MKFIELIILNALIVWHVNYLSIKLLKNNKQGQVDTNTEVLL